MAGFVYNLLLIIFSPLFFAYFLWRIFVSGKSNESWRQCTGVLPRLTDRPPDRKLIWVHAVSVGEVVASLPILDELRKLLPQASILLTTVTQTGNAVARKSARSAEEIAYLPLDYLPFVIRALNRVRPDAVVTVETEIWPNFLSAVERRGIPIILVNGCIRDGNFRRSLRWRWLMSWAISKFDGCYMQTETDAERIRILGARPECVRVLGSTKFDQQDSELPGDAVSRLRHSLGIPEGTPAFVAGSTNPGEEEPLLEAFLQMRKVFGDLRLLIAPRQIERSDEIQALVEARGLKCARRSRKDSAEDGFDVLILDSFGELASAYAVGEIAFVGGTLIPKGGHSLVQPVLHGKPVLFGPHTFKTRDMARMVISAGVGFEVKDAEELASLGTALLADAERRAEISASCRRMLSENRGASARCAALIVELLGVHTEAENEP